MQPEHKEILRSSRGMLQTIELDKVLPLMEVVFDRDDMEDIQSKTTATERFDQFIAILMRKEDKYFVHFVNVLKVTNPSFARFLMKEAKKPTSGTFNRLILLQFPVPF
jgi:hypothetical protein